MIDKESDEYSEVYDKAVKYFAGGADEKYIKFQLAEQGVRDELADAVLKDIGELSAGVKKRYGIRLMVLGTSFIAAGLLITFLTSSDSPVKAVLWGMPILGVVITVKGLGKILG